MQKASPALALAVTIEAGREALTRGEVPENALKYRFIEALAGMINEAMLVDSGDSAYKAMVLRHRAARVREYASLSAHVGRDSRTVRSLVNAFAHPAKLRCISQAGQREALAALHALASSESWSELSDAIRRSRYMPDVEGDPALAGGVSRLLDSPALARLLRLDILASDELVLKYQSLWDQHGPRSGSSIAMAQGAASRKRGAAVEVLAAQALHGLARRLNAADGQASYRVATSMRVPASIPGNSNRAKTEWDAVLLRRASAEDATEAWDLCLLVEAKASVDAATTDLPRLLRGLRLLTHAEQDVVYSFRAQEGIMRLRGASLSALPGQEADLARTVLYCCDVPGEGSPRLLSAASRMQLLSASASLDYASALETRQHAHAQSLGVVWQQLLESPRWGAVLNQYQTLRQARELMVHVDDLWETIEGLKRPTSLGESP